MNRKLEHLEVAVRYWKENHLDSYDFVFLMLTENRDFQSLFLNKLKNRKGIIIHGEEARQLLLLYSLYEFSGNIIIASFDQPYGRKLQNLLVNGIGTEEELINDVLLGEM